MLLATARDEVAGELVGALFLSKVTNFATGAVRGKTARQEQSDQELSHLEVHRVGRQKHSSVLLWIGWLSRAN
jgi:hypothetical protein